MSEGYTPATGAAAAGEGALSELLVSEDKIHNSLVPDDVVIRDYLNCINDDTWVRHAELVHVSDLKETPHEEAVKEEVLRTYIEERRRSNAELPRDLIMEGILWQEKFMDEYKKEHRTHDKEEASNYKKSLMESFRTKRSDDRIKGPAASDVKAIEYGGKRADGTNFSMNAADKSNKGTCDQPPSVYTPAVRHEEPTETAAVQQPVEEHSTPAANPAEYPAETPTAPVAEAVQEEQPVAEATTAPVTTDYPVEGQTAPAAEAVQETVEDADAAGEAPKTGEEYPADDNTSAPAVEPAGEKSEIDVTHEM
ncbi:hypothetical protein LSM04_005450 [Trypanosoma melophagium]|uniref:uncharacterized protein n=1 Tax=Trypanosoma melophagium TaxID=715481 RepID=UPI00351A59B1|nr:hypothetical protein LSM04_005450 [Trypanosoma melophagium]